MFRGYGVTQTSVITVLRIPNLPEINYAQVRAKPFGLYLAPAPQNRVFRKWKKPRLSVLVTMLALLGAGPSPAKNKRNDPDEIGKRDVGRGLNLYSFEKEAALGKELARDLEVQFRQLGEPNVAEYVNRLCQNLALNSDTKLQISAQVLDSEETNALTLPGGHIYVNAGLILTAQTEAELAAALAHEIGHVAARHATRQATIATIIDYGSLGLIFIGGQAGFAAMQAARLAVPFEMATFSRRFESEADFLGLQYAYKTGYDPTAFTDLLERLETAGHKKPNRVMGTLSSHPAVLKRTRAIQRNIQRFLPPKASYVVNTSEFDDIRARVLKVYSVRHRQREWGPPKLQGRSQ